jgi:hypothetical protein
VNLAFPNVHLDSDGKSIYPATVIKQDMGWIRWISKRMEHCLHHLNVRFDAQETRGLLELSRFLLELSCVLLEPSSLIGTKRSIPCDKQHTESE